MAEPVQIPLGLSLTGQLGFAGYVAGPNARAVATLRALAEHGEPRWAYLRGPRGVGKTHLLHAVCHAAGADNRGVYLPLGELTDAAALEGMHDSDPLCLDDIETVAGDRRWEEALFSLLNRVREQGGRLVLAAAHAPSALGVRLPDLLSRLSWGTQLVLHRPDDGVKREAIALRAQQRGLELPEAVADYLMRRVSRDLTSLCALVDRLDRESLAAQRRLTVPFVRKLLANAPETANGGDDDLPA